MWCFRQGKPHTNSFLFLLSRYGMHRRFGWWSEELGHHRWRFVQYSMAILFSWFSAAWMLWKGRRWMLFISCIIGCVSIALDDDLRMPWIIAWIVSSRMDRHFDSAQRSARELIEGERWSRSIKQYACQSVMMDAGGTWQNPKPFWSSIFLLLAANALVIDLTSFQILVR